MPLRVATFNLENLDDGPDGEPTLSDRIRIMQPQLERVRADVLCLQEVHSHEASGDFNAEADEVPIKTVCGHVEETGNPDHSPRVMVPCENNIPESARQGSEIHNEALPDESGAFGQDIKFPDSDHAPVIAEFGLT
jgi:exonuclease III